MIVDNGKYYLYRHVRQDKNVPFYIGIGTKPTPLYKSNEYSRAIRKGGGRKSYWNNIVNKTSYEVDILLESDDYYFIKQKEVEFIKLYGRINLGTGSLVNLTDGGEGSHGYIVSEETRKKIGENGWCKGKFGKDHHRSKVIYQYDFEGNFIKEWIGINEVQRAFNVKSRIDTNRLSYCGYMWFFDYKGEKTSPYKNEWGTFQKTLMTKPVYQYSNTGDFIKKWDSHKSIEVELNIRTSRISEACKRESSFHKGYYWFLEFKGDKLENIIKPKGVVIPVIQLDKLSGEVLNTFDNAKLASFHFNKNSGLSSAILSCCNGIRKTCKGYNWKFKIETNDQ